MDDDKGQRNKKRQRTSLKRTMTWNDQPAFLDASASIAVATFGARRLPELQQLYRPKALIQAEHVAFESGGGQTSSRHLRRRTTSHQSRRHRHRFPSNPPPKTSTTRKAKRSCKESLCEGHFDWNVPTNESTRPHWMMTHLWHAKRFHVQTLWGWRVPVAHTNRGARAVLRLTSREKHTTLQDLSFCRQPIRIQSLEKCSKEDLVKCMGRILPDWSTDPSVVTTTHMGEGMLHHVDMFPRGAIGPIVWHVTHDASAEQWNVDLRIHPSICHSVMDCLKALQSSCPSQLKLPSFETNTIKKLCCFRIAGANATQILQDVLNPLPSTDLPPKECEWTTLLHDDASLSHGLIAKVSIDAKSGDDALLVRQLPRSMDCDANRAVAGWDLYYSSAHAYNIWMALALKCVVIGMVEQMHLNLECEPPVLTFPRDYMDTEASQQYWECEDTDWRFVRQLYEGGWGRLPIKKKVSLKKISWKALTGKNNHETNQETVQEKDNSSQDDPVIVRGAFGQPFLAVLLGCGQSIQPYEENNRCGAHRRKRRRSVPFHAVRQAQPCNRQYTESWRQMIHALLRNLTLPAILNAHIRVAGEGTVHAGDEIYVGSTFAGIITAGCFSPIRGVCHGLAALSAHKILEALANINMSTQHIGRVVRLSNGTKQLQVAGSIGPQSDQYNEVTISLIL